MKITAIKTYRLREPQPTLLIKIETDEGVSGWGETLDLPAARTLISEQYAPILIGRDPTQHRPNWRSIWGRAFGNPVAVGGMDIALEDLWGKALGQPLAELYGGRLREEVDVMVPVADAREAADAAARGIHAVALRIGDQELSRDLAAVDAVRAAVGPEGKLLVDGGGAFTLGRAAVVARELEKRGVYAFKEPSPGCSPEYPGYETLAGSLDVPIAAGDTIGTRARFRAAFERRAMDIALPDVSLACGVGECLAVAEMGRQYGILCLPQARAGALLVAATAHLVSLLPDASWSRWTEAPMMQLGSGRSPFFDPVIAPPWEFRNGRLVVPRRAGLGVEIDEEKVRRLAG